jgi:hypothetical protein
LQKLAAFRGSNLVITMCIDAKKCDNAQVALAEQDYVSTVLDRQWITSDGYTPFWVVLYKVDPPPQMDPTAH